jgi:parallel beta-helix repeat protein
MICIAILLTIPRTSIATCGISPNLRAEGFTTIQKAINYASPGDTVVVPTGTYCEHIIVNKTVSLIGENSTTTVIDGSEAGTVVSVIADNVSIVGLTIRNSGWGWVRNGIYVQGDNCRIMNNRLIYNCHNIRLNYSRNSQVLNNVVDGNGYGIRLIHAVDCIAIGNNVSDCIGGVHLEFATNCTVSRNHLAHNDQGIRMYSPCTFNKITANTVANSTYDGMIDDSMNGNSTFFENTIFHNSFVNNTYPFICKGTGNIWHDDYPSGGNYWSRYNGTDQFRGSYQNETGSDGIGDVPYAINGNNIDKYPFMRQWTACPVSNLNTSIGYVSIQEAIDAPETLDGHTIQVDSGFYYERINVHKQVKLLGENKFTTIIDGNSDGTVLSINADNVSISRFTIQNAGFGFPPEAYCGVLLKHRLGCSITHCLISRSRIGIYLFFSRQNTIERNVVYNNHEDGIWLWYSGNNTINGNDISANRYNFGVFGGDISDFDNLVYTNNTVDGRPIKYLIGVDNGVYDQMDIGVLYLIDCSNVTVKNLHLTKNGHGVFCYNVTNSRIENVTTEDNNYGIYLQKSTNNTVASSHCMNDWVGICLQDSNRNSVKENTLGGCEKGILLYDADRNSLDGNTLRNNLYGIRLFSSSFNSLVHNNILDNTVQVDLISSYANVWDNGCEGNYWSTYNGTDLDGDGVGDTHLPCEGVDDYPLVTPYMTGDINHDGRIDILDLVKVCASYMATPSDSSWNPHADIAEPYGIIDLLDVVKVKLNYGNRLGTP